VSGFKRLVLKRHGREARIVLFGQELDFPPPTLPVTIRIVSICRTEGGRRPIE
jgi:hypothetical protein